VASDGAALGEKRSAITVAGTSGTPLPRVRKRQASMVRLLVVRSSGSLLGHPHMLRHACGYALANRGHDTRALQAYLGHKNIQHTVRYTELSPTRFKNLWRE
jgi:site-specific recombinase XerD